ncbi:MAG: GldM family protein [Crocinitomix sp.]|nr:GldM family protein [Crocinitomix sp.]
MNKLLLLGILAICTNVLGQDYVISNQDLNTVYRGYNNKVVFGTVDGFDGYSLEVENGSLSEAEDGSYYILVPGPKHTCTVIFNDTVNNKELNRINFQVNALPTPSLYWGGYMSGSHLRGGSQRKLTLVYDPDISLNGRFTIKSMTVFIEGKKSISCDGNNLSDTALSAIKIVKGGKVSIIVTAVGTDGISRKVAGSWLVN